MRVGSVCRLLIKEKSKNHEVDFVAGDALLMRAYSLIQVSVDMASEKTREREIAALDASMAQFDLGESGPGPPGPCITVGEHHDAPG